MCGNFTFSKYRVTLSNCAVYQTQAQRPKLSLVTLPNTSKLRCIIQAWLAWLQILARPELVRLPITPIESVTPLPLLL
jgi:hypothetical protein